MTVMPNGLKLTLDNNGVSRTDAASAENGPQLEALYEQCNVGMPVYIIKQAGQIAFDCTKHPFWWGHE